MFNFPIRSVCIFLVLIIAVVTAGAQESTIASSSDDPANGDLIENVKKGRLEQVIALLSSGISPDSTDADGNTPLCWAVRLNRIDIVEILLANKASVDQEEGDGATALDVAAAIGRSDLVNLLIAHGANVNHKDNGGHTTLMSAALGTMFKSLPPFLVKLFAPDEKDFNGLVVSIGSQHEAVARILLEAGADPNAVAEDCDQTALMIVAMSCDSQFARFLFREKIKLTKETRAKVLRFVQVIDSDEALQLELDRISNQEEKQKVLNWHQLTSVTRREILKMIDASEAQDHSIL